MTTPRSPVRPGRRLKNLSSFARQLHVLVSSGTPLAQALSAVERQAEQEILRSRARYQDLYDSAPVGYVTLDRDGAIRQANLEAARLLGVERSLLVGRHLHGFLATPDGDAFGDFLSLAFKSCTKERCDVTLVRKGQDPIVARIDFLAFEDGQSGRVVLVDLT